MISVSPKGVLRFVYADELLDLAELGTGQFDANVKRASTVEPESGGWVVRIIDGPWLGPFPTRAGAIQAEVEWLEENVV